MAKTSKQNGINNCWLFAIATASALALDLNPVQSHQSSMREHFLKCLEMRKLTPFPAEGTVVVYLHHNFILRISVQYSNIHSDTAGL